MADCDDGAFCNGAEVCDVQNDCQAGTPPVTDDGVGCTDDSCDESQNLLIHVPDAGTCGDGGGSIARSRIEPFGAVAEPEIGRGDVRLFVRHHVGVGSES